MMVTQDFIASFTAVALDPSVNQKLHFEQYAQQQVRFHAQPLAVQQTLEIQAKLIARGIQERLSPIYFVLPEQIACEVDGTGQVQLQPVPPGLREQKIGALLGLLSLSDIDQRLKTLEVEADPAVSTGAGLMRFSIALSLVRSVLPAGRREGVIFDENNNLLVNSIGEAKEKISAMRHSLDTLEHAQALAPYITADNDFQCKRHGLVGQMGSQGRALAHHELGEIIRLIRRRVEAHALNRGFTLSLPYFDDQNLEMKIHSFEVIPAGRVGFDPFFVVWAARYQQSEISNQKKMNPSTRDHLLDLLKTLERAFDKPDRRLAGL
jgi:hypothetical protein